MGEKELKESFKEINSQCDKRMAEGRIKYGHYDPETDTRDWYNEQIEELLDLINYAKFQIVKLKQLQNDHLKHRPRD